MIDVSTQLFGIIGNPVRHSLSPVLHNGAFHRMGLNAAYLAFEPVSVEDALRGVRGLGVRGLSVTMPFKRAVIPFLDELQGIAREIQSVNTIANRGGRLIGYNTDCPGAVGALEEKIHLPGKRVLLLGAGGAARAIAFGLKESGCRITIGNRSAARGKALAEELGVGFASFPSAKSFPLEAQIIVNATSVGMEPNQDQTPLPGGQLDSRVTVMDIVTRPLRTRSLREAEERGCRVIDGLEMLARQGAAQLEIWTGIRPELGPIRDDLRRALEQKG